MSLDFFVLYRAEQIKIDYLTIKTITGLKIAAGFKAGLTTGTIKSEQFVLGTSARDSSDRFIYNSNNGALLFDSDGTGSLVALQIATLSNKLLITNADIFVI